MLNDAISKSRLPSYASKVTEALGPNLRTDINFVENKGNVGFNAKVTADDIISFVIEVDKR